MATSQEIIDVETTTGTMAVLRTRPAGDSPAKPVGIFFDAPGIRDATRAFSSKLAEAGYDVVVPDLYHREERLFSATPDAVAADAALRPRMRELMGTLTDDNIQADMADACAAVGFDGPMACVGFCLGARAVHRALTRHPDRFVAGAMWHPSFLADDEPDSPHLSAGDITSPLYVGIGEADEVQSIAMHQRWLDAVASKDNVDVVTFAGADHGFSWPGYATYHPAAADTSFARTTAIFAQAF